MRVARNGIGSVPWHRTSMRALLAILRIGLRSLRRGACHTRRRDREACAPARPAPPRPATWTPPGAVIAAQAARRAPRPPGAGPAPPSEVVRLAIARNAGLVADFAIAVATGPARSAAG
ncbi:hypothetical protein [Sorangium sp. So ce1000]|uniref:hypothetical protein n=1 Tax=Sorangium sp. So ce1000 TaxID=3133325 RepID=UPI003F614185